jgi:hypothetical protein
MVLIDGNSETESSEYFAVGWDMSVVVEIDFVQNIVNDRTTEHCGKLLWVL